MNFSRTSFFVLAVFSFGLTGACANSNFASGTPQTAKNAGKGPEAKTNGKSKPTGDDAGSDSPGTDDAGDGGNLGTSDGEEKQATPELETTEDCAQATGLADASGTFVFANESEVRDFINGLGKYTHISPEFIGAGGVRADQPSATAVCNAKGYKSFTGMQQASYHSCHDNFVFPWDDAQKNFIQHNACDFNQRISGLTCQGKLKDICGKDPGWVFGQTTATTPTP